MAVRLVQVSASPRFGSTTLKPASWSSFTVFQDLVMESNATPGIRNITIEDTAVSERMGMDWEAGTGVLRINKVDSGGAGSTTATMLTDTALGTKRQHILVCLTSDGTTLTGYHLLPGGDVVKTTLALGTKSAAPNAMTFGGTNAGGGSAATIRFHGALVYDALLTDTEVGAQLRAGLGPAPLYRQGLIGHFTFPGNASGLNVLGTTDLTVTGTPEAATDDSPSSVLPWWRTFASAAVAAAADQPFWRRRALLDADAEELPRRRLWAPLPDVVAADQPFVRARRPLEEPPEEPRPRRLFAPIPAAAPLADQPWVRARRVLDDAQDEPAVRRMRAPIPPAVAPDNPPPRASTARARMLADESREEPDPRARKPFYGPQGSISTTTDTSAAAVDLTAIGTSDWRTFVGTALPADMRRKVSGANQISDWALIGGSVGPFWSAGTEPNVVQWSDGDPVPVGSHAGILFTSNLGGGFTFTAPADQTPRTLHLYLSVSNMGLAAFNADLSDLSAPQASGTVGANGSWNIHLTYTAASPGQTIIVNVYSLVGAGAQMHVRGLALAGPAVPNDMPFVRRAWQALASWVTDEVLPARRPRVPILAAVTPDNPPPRVLHRTPEEAPDEPRAKRAPAPIVPAVVVDNPPPRARQRREEEPESITGRVVRKLAPQPAAVVDNPPPRAGRSNWRVAWETWEPVELLRKVYRLVFPGAPGPVNNQVVRPPLVARVDALDQAVAAPGVAQVAVFDDRDLTVTPDT